MSDWIQTFTGKEFYPLSPSPEQVDIRDIAHALALKTRYNGHCNFFYSVAQHSLLMSHYLKDDPFLSLWALMHDAGEAYLADIPRPVKPFFFAQISSEEIISFSELETRVLQTIFAAVTPSLSWSIEPQLVKSVDTRILVNEATVLMDISKWGSVGGIQPLENVEITPMFPHTAEQLFLNRFHDLTTEMSLE